MYVHNVNRKLSYILKIDLSNIFVHCDHNHMSSILAFWLFIIYPGDQYINMPGRKDNIICIRVS